MTAKDIISPKLLPVATASPRGRHTERRSVAASAPLSLVLRHAGDYGTIMNVVDDDTGEPIGTIDAEAIALAAAGLFPAVGESCDIVVRCPRADYSASAIARAVEDCDAHLLNLNVTNDDPTGAAVTVSLRVSHSGGAAVARSLERYGYSVVAVAGDDDPATDVARERVNELLHYLEV